MELIWLMKSLVFLVEDDKDGWKFFIEKCSEAGKKRDCGASSLKRSGLLVENDKVG
jgi:hypothetical protein